MITTLLTAVALGGAIYVKSTQPAADKSVDQVSGNTKGDSVTSEPDANKPQSDGAASPTATVAADFKAPTLQKSSGNNGPVPKGVTIEFVCEGAPGLSCEVFLTDKNNINNVIKLGSKKIVDNGRGQYFATWEWDAQPGSWRVVARATNGSASKSSAEQSLVVNP